MVEQNTWAINAYNHKDIVKKYMQALTGVCTGLIADNELSEKEFNYLRHWIEEHKEYLEEWPGNILSRKINTILEDGVISEDELSHFKDVLSALVGGTLEEVGSSSANSTTLPLNLDAQIVFPERSFCLLVSLFMEPGKHVMTQL